MNQTSSETLGNEESLLAKPNLEVPPQLLRSRREAAPMKPIMEACAAWERSLRPGQYFSEKGGHRPMRHRTQAVKGHPGARAWPRGPDGGAWGPQHLSPIPSEQSYAPLVPSPTMSPGRRSRGRGGGAKSPAVNAAAVAEAFAAEFGLDDSDGDSLKPFGPIPLEEEPLPPPLPTAPLEAPWRSPPPGFDLRTLRRQASNLRADGATTIEDQVAVHQSSQCLAEILSKVVENGRENSAAARVHLCRLHAAFQRLKRERLAHGEVVRSAVAWEESVEELRDKLESSVKRLQSAESAKVAAQRALDAAVESNRTVEAEVVPLERALQEAQHRDTVAAEMEREARQEDIADAFRRRDRGKPFVVDNNDQDHSTAPSQLYIGGAQSSVAPSKETAGGAAILAAESNCGAYSSPLLAPTLSWGFHLLKQACRRSRCLRNLAAARHARMEARKRDVLREAIAAWAVATALAREEWSARRRRVKETARLCLARWRLFAALEKRFRAEHRRRVCLRVMAALRAAVEAGRRSRNLDRRLDMLLVRHSFRAWRVLRARSTLTPQEYEGRRRIADHHRLQTLFETWHMASLASATANRAAIRGFQRQREIVTLATNFKAWVSLSRARVWRRHRCLRLGFAALKELTAIGHGRQECCGGFESGLVYLGFAGASSGASPMTKRPVAVGQLGDETYTVREFDVRDAHAQVTAGSGNATGCGVARRHRVWGERRGRWSYAAAEAAVLKANAHQRRVMLSRALQGFLSQPAVATERWRAGDGGWVAARAALVAWREAARLQRRDRGRNSLADDALRMWSLASALRGWRKVTLSRALCRKRRRKLALRSAFVSLRQACATSAAQRAAGRAVLSILRRRYTLVMSQAMRQLLAALPAAGGGPGSATVILRGRAARRRREREALATAWRWWVGGWIRRKAEMSRARELEVQRERQRDRDVLEQRQQVEKASAALSREAFVLEKELQNATLLLHEQGEALACSTKALDKASADTAELKSRLAIATGSGNRKGKGRSKPDGDVRQRASPPARGRERAGGRQSGDSRLGVTGSDEDRRLRARRLAQQRGAARVLQAAEGRRREAEERAAFREQAAARARTTLLEQQKADMAAIENARAVAQRYSDILEKQRTHAEKAERERLRVQAETTRLLEKADGLERRAEEEATQGARAASGTESERAALSLEVCTAEARAKELMAIADERQQEADRLRQALAGRDCERQETLCPSVALQPRSFAANTTTSTKKAQVAFSAAKNEGQTQSRKSRVELEGGAHRDHCSMQAAGLKDLVSLPLPLQKKRLPSELSAKQRGRDRGRGGGRGRDRDRGKIESPQLPGEGASSPTSELYNDLQESISVLQKRVSSSMLPTTATSSASPPGIHKEFGRSF